MVRSPSFTTATRRPSALAVVARGSVQKDHATIGIIGRDHIFVSVVVDVSEFKGMKEGLGRALPTHLHRGGTILLDQLQARTKASPWSLRAEQLRLTIVIEIMQIVSLSPRVFGVFVNHRATIELIIGVAIDNGLSRWVANLTF